MADDVLHRFSKEEKEALIHAFQEEILRVDRGGGNQYGHLSLNKAKTALKHLKGNEAADLCLV